MPDHAPEAVQLVALREVQLSVDAPPEATEVGDALIDTVGAGVAVTIETVADFELEVPLELVQVKVYVVLAEIGPTVCVPEVATEPLQPPEAVQLLAFVVLQVSVEDPCEFTCAGEAERAMAGALGAELPGRR